MSLKEATEGFRAEDFTCRKTEKSGTD